MRYLSKAPFVFVALAALVWLSTLVYSCSPVNVQVQQCENVVKNSHGFTFTGCRVDGDQKNEPSGTLEVKIPPSPPYPEGPNEKPTSFRDRSSRVRAHLLN